ncbi:MAG: hypothetical protein MK076_10300 [Flavobacteriales bacterium]|nr:hypothetical protein [Flavobacteriales bacterium]
MYFSYEYVSKNSDNYLKARSEYQTDIESATAALNVIMKQVEGTPAYTKYKQTLLKKSESKARFNQAKNEERVFDFKTIRVFLYELGPNICWFVFLVFITFRSFYFEYKNMGVKVLYTVMISLTVFKFYYIFQQFQDVSKALYYVLTFLSAGVVVLAISLISKHQRHYINKLKETISRLVAFSFLHTKQEKKQEMLQMFRDLSKED